MTADSGDRAEGAWERGWDGHVDAQLLRMASLPLVEKLRWLEEAHDLVRHLSAQARTASGEFQLPEGRDRAIGALTTQGPSGILEGLSGDSIEPQGG